MALTPKQEDKVVYFFYFLIPEIMAWCALCLYFCLPRWYYLIFVCVMGLDAIIEWLYIYPHDGYADIKDGLRGVTYVMGTIGFLSLIAIDPDFSNLLLLLSFFYAQVKIVQYLLFRIHVKNKKY